MSWIGKLLGGAFGFMMGGPLGALAGVAFGHQFDSGYRRSQETLSGPQDLGDRERTQTAFFTATFAVMGRVAKADGRVTPDEIRKAGAVMQQMRLTPQLRRAAETLFTQGKQPDFPLEEVLDQLRRECHMRHRLLRMFLEIQFQAAYADGTMHPEERRLLLHIAERLGFSRREFDDLDAMTRAEQQFRGRRSARQRGGLPLSDAYAMLQVPPDIDDAGLKKAYRRLMSQHHPDKLVARGLPEEMIKVATEKTQDIQAAYERIRETRRKP